MTMCDGCPETKTPSLSSRGDVGRKTAQSWWLRLNVVDEPLQPTNHPGFFFLSLYSARLHADQIDLRRQRTDAAVAETISALVPYRRSRSTHESRLDETHGRPKVAGVELPSLSI